MLRLLSLAVLLSIGAARAPVPFPASWPRKTFVRWVPQWGDRTIDVSGVHVRVEVKHCGVDRPSAEDCYEGSPYLYVTASAPGMAPVTLRGTPGVAAEVGIGTLRPNPSRPSVILISEDGGSAGCVQIDIAEAQSSGYRALRLSADAGDGGTICGRSAEPWELQWPSDLTGHHRSEFLLWPQMFACDFTSCAGGWKVPQVIALDGPSGRDVSDDPVLAPLYRANMAYALSACQQEAVEAQGPCAGYAFDAARLGILDQAWPVIDAQIRRGCRVPDETPCADVDHIPADFHERLSDALASLRHREQWTSRAAPAVTR
jgi:hypothetical protein